MVSLTWVIYLGGKEKRISIPKNDLYFLVNNSKLRLTYLILPRVVICGQELENSKSIYKVQVELEREQFVRYYFMTY